jgi:hypothetical protein
MVRRRKNPKEVSGTSSTVVLSLRPRGLRPPSAAAYLGTTPFAIQEAMRSGALPFRIVGGARVIAIEDLDKFFESIEPQTGKLAGRGRFLEAADKQRNAKVLQGQFGSKSAA